MSDHKFNPPTADIVIIGGGVIGLTIARALRRRGVSEVLLIERRHPGAEASWAAAGMLAPQVEADQADDFFSLACASRDLYPAFAAALEEETGIDVELDTSGTLCVGLTPQDGAELRQRYEWQTNEGLEVEWLQGKEARRLEPCISANVTAALRFPNDWQVENRRLVQALVSANQRLAVQMVTDCAVSAIRIEQKAVRGVETSKGFFATPTVIVAAGAWSSTIDVPGRPLIEIEPVRGQMLCFSARPEIGRQVIYGPRGYLVTRRDGRVLAGSTAEHAGFDSSVTEDGASAIKAMTLEISEAIGSSPVIDAWAGLRPHAKDDLPVLGTHGEIRGLLYATGHYRNGILLAPITGDVVADAVVDDVVRTGLTAFSPDRFHTEPAIET